MLVQAVKEDNQAMVEELVSQGEDVTRSDDVGQASVLISEAVQTYQLSGFSYANTFEIGS